MIDFPIIVLAGVFLLIAFRQVARVRLEIWHIMALGAAAVLASGDISPRSALASIDLDVMLFLFGMFVVGEALRESNYLAKLAHKIFSRTRTIDGLVLAILFFIGGLSAILMNDTLAIIGTPLAIYFARRHGVSPRLMLITLAVAVTTGSVASPIGNPQNLLIAVNSGMEAPFIEFARYLLIPTALNLLLAYAALRIFFRREFKADAIEHIKEAVTDKALARLSRIALAITGVMIAAKVAVVALGLGWNFRLTYIALAAAAPVILFSRKRMRILSNIDWATLVFFAAMFVLMRAVWDCGFFQEAMARLDVDVASTGAIIGVSVVLSQFISNVPLVALCLPMVMAAGNSARAMAALAAGSTIAGNLSILGAASNVIIIHNAEKEGETITFWDFAKVGVPLTAAQAAVYWAWLKLV